MLETVKKPGIHAAVEGDLPPKDPQKHVAAAAIHECLTNTLCHAHGDELTVSAAEREKSFVIIFTNKNDQRVQPIQEKGGFSSLSSLAENTGGSMPISAAPTFSGTLILPREVTSILP